MNISCAVIEDLLPLYADGLACEDSRALVETHLQTCPACRSALDALRASIPAPKGTDADGLLRVRDSLRRQRRLAVWMAVLLTLVVATAALCCLTAPAVLPYQDGMVSVQAQNGELWVHWRDPAVDCEVTYLEVDGRLTCSLSCRSNAWDKFFSPNATAYALPLRAGVDSVRYTSLNGSPDVLLYGTDNGEGVITLPRLTLNYWALLAVGVAIVSALAALLLRGKARRIALRVLAAPLCWLAAYIVVMRGITPYSQALLRDFCAIALLGMLLYALWICAIRWMRALRARAK